MRRLKTDGRMIDVDDRLDDLRALLGRTPGLVGAYLFGSYGTPRQTPLSDVDLALVFRAGAEPAWEEELALRPDILETLGEEDVSIVVLNRAPSPFQYEVLSTGRRLWCGDEAALADFVQWVLKVYGDFGFDYRAFLKEYDRVLVERYGCHGECEPG